MAKKFVPSIPVHKVKFMKRDNKKKLLFKRVLNFLKSDNYMFAPLVSSQSSSLFTISTGVEENEPIEGKNKKFLGKMNPLKDYMKSDCYMYAPLVMNQPWLRAATCPVNPRPGPVSFSESTADTSRQRDTTKIVAGETKDLGQNIKSISTGEQHVPYTRSAVIRHTLLQRETVKHVIQQNVRASSAQGDVKKEKKGGKGNKIKGRNSRNTKKKKGLLGANTRKLASE